MKKNLAKDKRWSEINVPIERPIMNMLSHVYNKAYLYLRDLFNLYKGDAISSFDDVDFNEDAQMCIKIVRRIADERRKGRPSISENKSIHEYKAVSQDDMEAMNKIFNKVTFRMNVCFEGYLRSQRPDLFEGVGIGPIMVGGQAISEHLDKEKYRARRIMRANNKRSLPGLVFAPLPPLGVDILSNMGRVERRYWLSLGMFVYLQDVALRKKSLLMECASCGTWFFAKNLRRRTCDVKCRVRRCRSKK